ncbi:hypothetical protein [Kitasatospora kazusensis]|uniref:hypothetical protein n=1 Tax=Kitasatospora kazusensis TaxID=407974 RepID=UPI0031D82768
MSVGGDLDVRRAALTIAQEVEELDRAALRGLGPEAFDVQYEARAALIDHVRSIWDALKARGVNPAVRPEYQPLAALQDLLTALGDHAAHTDHPGD